MPDLLVILAVWWALTWAFVSLVWGTPPDPPDRTTILIPVGNVLVPFVVRRRPQEP